MADYPIKECIDTASKLIEKGIDVYQKWTCGSCGSRQTMSDVNVFYLSGHCEECKAVTKIERCNYMVHAQGSSAAALLKDMQRK